jgi:choline dehydrogenase-like flavoprotein
VTALQTDPSILDEHLFTTFEQAAARTYDVVVVGGGGTGSVLVATLLRSWPDARVLVLEQGPFLLPDHVQNLGLSFQPLMSAATASPWRSEGDLDVVAQVPFLGGRTLVWSGSCPRPTPEQLGGWPVELVDDLGAFWPPAQELLGVVRAGAIGPEFGALHEQLRSRVFDGAADVPHVELPDRVQLLDAPLAMDAGREGTSKKFSAVPVLLEAAAQHAVDIVTSCHVERVEHVDGRAVGVVTDAGRIDLRGARVVLALGTTESTRLVLDTLVDAAGHGVGTHLEANTATFLTCRLPRSAFDGLSADHVEAAALYVDGRTPEREFHLHVTACATTDPDRDLRDVYRLMPDMFGDGTPRRVSDPEHVVLLVNGLAELAADPAASEPSDVTVGPDGTTVGRYRLGPADHAVWDAMDAAADGVIQVLAAGAVPEYWWPEEQVWSTSVPPRRMPFAVHESGTLRMGRTPETSVTDLTGRVHALDGVYVTGGAVFPTRGSWNPFLTMAALTMRLAQHLAVTRPVGTATRPVGAAPVRTAPANTEEGPA